MTWKDLLVSSDVVLLKVVEMAQVFFKELQDTVSCIVLDDDMTETIVSEGRPVIAAVQARVLHKDGSISEKTFPMDWSNWEGSMRRFYHKEIAHLDHCKAVALSIFFEEQTEHILLVDKDELK